MKIRLITNHIYTSQIYLNNHDTQSLLMDSPFGNCQILSINNFKGVLECLNEYKGNKRKFINEFKEMLAARKNILQIDVNIEYESSVRRYFRKDIIRSMKYTSTNNSKMIQFLIRTT